MGGWENFPHPVRRVYERAGNSLDSSTMMFQLTRELVFALLAGGGDYSISLRVSIYFFLFFFFFACVSID